MSQAQGAQDVFNLARTAYLRVVELLGPAALILTTTTLGGVTLGPPGIFAGAAAGAAGVAWAERLLAFCRVILLFFVNNPHMFFLVKRAIEKLIEYINNFNRNGENHQKLVKR